MPAIYKNGNIYGAGGGGGGTAATTTYDNTESDLTATNVQDAIDEVVEIKANQMSLTQAQYDALVQAGTVDLVNTIYFITDGDSPVCSASEVTYSNTSSGLSADTVQDAIDEIHISKMNITNPTGTGSFSLNRKSNTTVGTNSVATGNNCEASGNSAYAEGYHTSASGDFGAHAEGINTIASGSYGAHAEGVGTTANHRAQHTFGEYNVLDTSTAESYNRGNYVEIVGNGTSSFAPSNARTLDWSGNEVLAGGLKINGTQDVATQTYVDTGLSGKQTKAVDSGWQNLNVSYAGTVEKCRYRKIDNIVYIEFFLTTNTFPTTWGTVLGTVPDVIKPATEISIVGRGGRDFALFSISNNGNIYFLKSNNTYTLDNRLTFYIVYCM